MYYFIQCQSFITLISKTFTFTCTDFDQPSWKSVKLRCISVNGDEIQNKDNESRSEIKVKNDCYLLDIFTDFKFFEFL